MVGRVGLGSIKSRSEGGGLGASRGPEVPKDLDMVDLWGPSLNEGSRETKTLALEGEQTFYKF